MKRKLFGTQNALSRKVKAYAHEEDGVVTLFALFVIMMMVLVGGISIDLMRNELDRVTIQQVSDRAALAAADLDQTLDPEDVVNDYFDKAGMSHYLSAVHVDEGQKYRVVTVETTATTKTQFMHFMGVDQLSAPASSTAEERISKVEVSLVLDISGSMATNNRIGNLRDASKTFVNTLIRPETQDLISISVIPYSEHVNAGEDLFRALPSRRIRHDESWSTWCVEFPDWNFNDTTISTSHQYDQMQHFQWYYSSQNRIDNTVCPRRSYEEIQPFSQSVPNLEAQLDQLQPRAQTSIFLGVKWAAALLDPSTRPMIDTMISKGKVDPIFSGRPAEHDDSETLKTIVVMTDGVNTASQRIKESRYNSRSEYRHWGRDWNFQYYLQHYVRSNRHHRYYFQKYSGSQGDALLHNVCTAAKNQGIVIWSVGFEVNNHGADVLQNCASSPSHFFRVEGVEITEAFQAIASQINQLRLTQ